MNDPARDLQTRIEPPARLFAAARRAWPWLWRSYARDLGLRGLGDLLRHWQSELVFDRRFGVRTRFLVKSADLGFEDGEMQAKSARYRATPPFCLATSLGRLSDRLGGLGREGLVDYGCGTGRALIVAAEAGVGRAVGLELSPDLVGLCRSNLARYAARWPDAPPLDVLQTDASAWVPPPEATIFYFFSPFHTDVFERALDNIRRSVRTHPRDIWVLLLCGPHFPTAGLSLVGQVTGIQTYTNARDRDAFVAAGREA